MLMDHEQFHLQALLLKTLKLGMLSEKLCKSFSEALRNDNSIQKKKRFINLFTDIGTFPLTRIETA